MQMEPANQMKSVVRSVTSTGPRGRIPQQSPVTAFLREIGLGQYAQALRTHGFEDLETLMAMREEHMREVGMATGHIVKLKRHLCDCEPSRFLATASPLRASIGGPRKIDSSLVAMTAVQRSWQQVKELGTDVAGGLFYKKFFEVEPSAKALFPMSVRLRYKNWDSDQQETDDMSESPALRRLWGRFIEVIGSAVAGLQDTAKMVPMLRELGLRHVGYGLKVEYFDLAGAILLEILADWLGESFNKEVENAWVMVSGFVIATIASGYNSALEGIRAKESELRSLSNNSMEPATPCSAAEGSIRLPSEAGSTHLGGSAHTPTAIQSGRLHEPGSANDTFAVKEVPPKNMYPPRLKMLVDGSSGGCYGIEWVLAPSGRLVHNSAYEPQWRLDAPGSKGAFAARSVTYTFMPGQGAVGEAFARKELLFLQEVQRLNRHLSTPFQRADLAKEYGINSILFVPTADGVLEIGSTKKFANSDDFLPPDLLADSP